MATPQTGTGLDRLVDIIETDNGIARRVSDSDIDKGAEAAAGLNGLIVQGIRELGVANDGRIDSADFMGLGDWVQADRARNDTYRELYGRNGGEGFQLVVNEDSSDRLFGSDAVDEVADAIYSFGFGSDNGRIFDVDGDLYRSVNLTAGWLDDLLSDQDLKTLSNSNGSTIVDGTTGTGLDLIIDIIQSDPGLIRNVSRVDMAEAARAADALNNMYLDGIKALGLANDGTIDKSDVVALSEWVQSSGSRFNEFRELHEDWRLVLNKGADIAQIDEANDGVHPHVGHVVNHAFRGLYDVGFGVDRKGMVLDIEGEPDVKVGIPADWLDQLLDSSVTQGTGGHGSDDHDTDDHGDVMPTNPDTPTSGAKDDLYNPDGSTTVNGTTGTGLDGIIDIIKNDPGVIRNVSRNDIAEAARAADAMNNIIVDVIETLGLARDGDIDRDDVDQMSDYIRADGALRDEFRMLHGAESGGGFDLVQGRGGTEKLFDKWAVNNVFDAVYSLGQEIERNRFVDEDGDLSYGTSLAASGIDEFYF